MNRILTFFITVLLLCGGTIFGQHYTDWSEFKYLPGRLDSDDKIVFYELQRDYTICLAEYFLVAENLPDCCEDEVGFYKVWAANSLPPCDWDFISLEFGGILTVKKGYRWDGASNPFQDGDKHHNFRSSLVHDALYDLMRMAYLEPDGVGKKAGNINRKMADMIHYMIAIEDGDSKSGAQSDYFWLRLWGGPATHNDKKLKVWKYHVSELTAYPFDGVVELEWKHADEAGVSPNSTTNNGYSIQRDGQEIATVMAFEGWPLTWITSYTDHTAVEGNIYGYQLIPLSENTNQDDWPNEDIIIPLNGPGNALVLDGSNDYIEANTVSNDLSFSLFPTTMSNITYEAWVYPEEPADQAVIMAFNTITGGNYNLLSYKSSTQKFYYYDDNNSFIASTDEFPSGNWYHVAVTINFQNKGILYINGIEQAAFTTIKPSHGAKFSIGQEWDNATTTQHFKGMIDEVRIWTVARTQEEIQTNMNIPLRGDESGLVALWHFDEPHETNLFTKTHDATAHANDGLLIGYESSDLPFVPSGAMGNVTEVSDKSDDVSLVPEIFALYPNFPNPFNPVTHIKYSLPQTAHVKLEIFDMLGRKIKVLLDEQKQAGYHTLKFEAGNLAAGVYIYRIQADHFTQTRKLLLLK
jgi:hypothetical protein